MANPSASPERRAVPTKPAASPRDVKALAKAFFGASASVDALQRPMVEKAAMQEIQARMRTAREKQAADKAKAKMRAEAAKAKASKRASEAAGQAAAKAGTKAKPAAPKPPRKRAVKSGVSSRNAGMTPAEPGVLDVSSRNVCANGSLPAEV